MLDILHHAGMVDCKPCSTPVDTNPKVAAAEGALCLTLDFRTLARALQYLFTRPNIAYAVQQVCLHMHDPREPHLAALKRILCYVQGTLCYGRGWDAWLRGIRPWGSAHGRARGRDFLLISCLPCHDPG